MHTNTLIVGGGLSGLYLADQLQRAGVDYHLLEAGDRFGGRILSETHGGAKFDLGPAWFWPGQPRIASLLTRLNLTSFEQYSTGDIAFQDQSGRVQRNRGFASMQGALRVAGGLGAVIAGLVDGLPSKRVHLNSQVVAATRRNGPTTVSLRTAQGKQSVTADRLVLSIPPRVAAAAIKFDPPLPASSMDRMQKTATWMAGQAKILAVYDQPYWRMAGLSGDATSHTGPMVEIHDASPRTSGPYALFGFVGFPAQVRQEHPDQILEMARDQLVAIFGPDLKQALNIHMMDWARNPHIATAQDQVGPSAHPTYGLPPEFKGLWGDSLLLSCTETAPKFGGFVEGALEAAEATLAQLRARAQSPK